MLLLLVTLAAGCGVASGTPSPEEVAAPVNAAAQRPSVVLIMIDTLRADKVGSYGCPLETTPALDAFAAKGVQFDSVMAQSSWTRPSVGSFLTSRYPRTLGLYREREETLPEHFETLAEVLKGNAYTTFGFTANPNINAAYHFAQGFDRYYDSTVLFPTVSTVPDGATLYGEKPLPEAQGMFRQALAQLDASDAKGPFYLQFNVMEIHEWLVPHTRPNSMLRNTYKQHFQGKRYRQYLQSVRQVTDDIGHFVETLLARPGWADTVFIFLSDHGEGLGDHPDVKRSSFHGRLLYKSTLMVPWIMYRPGWTPARQRIAQHVRLLDMMPTLLDYLHIEGPKEMAGLSLMPLVNGEAERLPLPNYFVAETYWKRADKIAVYSADWEYFCNWKPQPGLGPLELQDRSRIENGLRTDLFHKKPEAAKKMQDFQAEWERKHRKAKPSIKAIPHEIVEQLEAIGYLGDDGEQESEPEENAGHE